eukprot:PhF_6_TR42909/c0_g1_i1/m.65026
MFPTSTLISLLLAINTSYVENREDNVFFFPSAVSNPTELTGIPSPEHILSDLVPKCLVDKVCRAKVVKRVLKKGTWWTKEFQHQKKASKIRDSLEGSDNATLILNDLQSVSPVLESITTPLFNDFNNTSGANLYYTPPNSQGFEAHFDVMNVIVVQVFGRKKWTVCLDPEVILPRPDEKRRPEKRCKNSQVYDMNPGDVLSIPRGHVHEATTFGMYDLPGSVHVTFSLEPKYENVIADSLQRLITKEAKRNVASQFFRGHMRSCGGVFFTRGSGAHMLLRAAEHVPSEVCRVLRRTKKHSRPYLKSDVISCLNSITSKTLLDHGALYKDRYVLEKVYAAGMHGDVSEVESDSTEECMIALEAHLGMNKEILADIIKTVESLIPDKLVT